MSHLSLSRSHAVLRIDAGTTASILEEVVSEHLLRVDVAGEAAFTLSCSPAHLEELVTGALFSRSLISAASDVKSLSFSEDMGYVRAELTPGAPAPRSHPGSGVLRLKYSHLCGLMERNLTASSLFRRTGGMHCVSLSLPESPILSMEDLARHNAVDKVIGYALLHDLPLECSVLAVSGRLSADMMEKAVRAGIPVVLSKGAPTDRSIRIAQENGVTLAGFVRGERVNLYTCPERIDITI